MDLPHQREAGEHAEDLTSEPEGVRFEDAPELGGFWAVPPAAPPAGAVLYLFGGGYVISAPRTRHKTAGHLARAAGARVLVPDYRLAPEHPFPAALDDAVGAYHWLLGHGEAPERTVVAGDSSAGGLAVATLLRLRDAGGPLPAGAVAISPWVDLAVTGDTMRTRAAADVCATPESLRRMAGQYLAGHDPRDPLASPLYGDLARLPPLLLLAGGDEVLLDDAVRLARATVEAGVDAELVLGGGMQHVYPLYVGAMPEADAAMEHIGAWIARRVART